MRRGWHYGGGGQVADKNGCLLSLLCIWKAYAVSVTDSIRLFIVGFTKRKLEWRRRKKEKEGKREDACNKCAEPHTLVGVCLCEEVWVKERQKNKRIKDTQLWKQSPAGEIKKTIFFCQSTPHSHNKLQSLLNLKWILNSQHNIPSIITIMRKDIWRANRL